jgi:hypothetical protein
MVGWPCRSRPPCDGGEFKPAGGAVGLRVGRPPKPKPAGIEFPTDFLFQGISHPKSGAGEFEVIHGKPSGRRTRRNIP